MVRIVSWLLPAMLAASLAAQMEGPEAGRKLAAASEALASGNGRAAALILDDLVRRAPELGTAWYQLAVARRLLRKDAEAFAAAERAEFLLPDSLDAKLLLGELCANSDAARAGKLIGEVLARGDDDAVLRRLLPIMVTASDDRAAATFAKVLATTPDDVELLNLKAQWALGNRDLDTALATMLQLQRLEPANPVTLQSLAQVQIAASKPQAATATLQKLLEVNPSNLEARMRLIALWREQQRPPAEIVRQEQLLAYYRAQVRRWEAAGQRNARPTAPAKPAK